MIAELINKQPQNCWEFHKCLKEVKEKCIVYKKRQGRECWRIIKTSTEGCPEMKKNDGSCFNCSWYKKVGYEFISTVYLPVNKYNLNQWFKNNYTKQ
jgi:hypothetical protein